MIRTLVFLFVLFYLVLSFLSSSATAQNADSLNTLAVSLIKEKDFDRAIPMLQQAAEAGHPEAQFNLSEILFQGIGVKVNPVEANLWLRKAALQEHVNAQYKLAYNYSLGTGVTKDLAQAFHWFEKAAENDDIEAQFIVIGMLLNGQGVKKDVPGALAWAQQLAVRENPENIELSGKITSARLNIAQLYLNGDNGVRRDQFEAYKWLLITNEKKTDFLGPYQQEIIDDIHDLEDELGEMEQARAREAAENALGRPLLNLENRHNIENSF